MVSIARSHCSGRTGAKPKPQLPIATEVTPCHPESSSGDPKNLRVVVSVQVDESRCDNQAGSVDLARTVAGVELPELGNPAILDSDVATIAGCAGPVDDHTVLNDRVEPGHSLVLCGSADCHLLLDC